jgi:hypothetical protein
VEIARNKQMQNSIDPLSATNLLIFTGKANQRKKAGKTPHFNLNLREETADYLKVFKRTGWSARALTSLSRSRTNIYSLIRSMTVARKVP